QTRNVQWVGQFLCANPTLPLQSGCKIGEDVSSFRFGIVRRWAQAPFRLGCSNRPISRAGMCQPKAEEPPHGSATKRGTDVTTQAETCSISFTVIKAGWVIGGSGGSGALRCGGRTYPLSIGGLSYGIMFGASETRFTGTATFRGSPYNVAGVYGAGGVGGAAG